MKIFRLKSELIPFLDIMPSKGKKIGFVPTMGALHEGHLALIQASNKETDLTVCSIFVNPTQFNNKEDLLKYPRTFEEDVNKLKMEGCDVIYAPPEEDLYGESQAIITSLHFGELENILEGKYRPGHFSGVAIVVMKLFNIIQPHFAYFGQKDLQQYYLIDKIIHDLSYNIQLRCVPTFRDRDGLAMSSRNIRIPDHSRLLAKMFYESLIKAREMLLKQKSVSEVKKYVHEVFSNQPELQLEYFELVDVRNFTIIDHVTRENKPALCIAGYLNNIRLIDNVLYI